MDTTKLTGQALQQAQGLQAMWGGGPMAGVAAVFAVAFFGLLGWHLWRMHALTRDYLKTAMGLQAAVNELLALAGDLRVIASDTARRNASAQAKRAREAAHAKPEGP